MNEQDLSVIDAWRVGVSGWTPTTLSYDCRGLVSRTARSAWTPSRASRTPSSMAQGVDERDSRIGDKAYGEVDTLPLDAGVEQDTATGRRRHYSRSRPGASA